MTVGASVGFTDSHIQWFLVSRDLTSTALICSACSALNSTLVMHFRRDPADQVTLNNLLAAVELASNKAATTDRQLDLVYAFQVCG